MTLEDPYQRPANGPANGCQPPGSTAPPHTPLSVRVPSLRREGEENALPPRTQPRGSDARSTSCRPEPRRALAHNWPKQPYDFYTEPAWCSERLFAALRLDGPVHDPCCGLGRVVLAARRAGLIATGSDIVARPESAIDYAPADFFVAPVPPVAIVSNPPFGKSRAPSSNDASPRQASTPWRRSSR